MITRLSTVYKTWNIGHYASFILVGILTVFAVVELRNIGLIWWFYQTTQSVAETSIFSFALLGGITTMFTTLGTVIVVLFSILFAANIVLLWQYVRLQRSIARGAGGGKVAAASTAGTIAALFGIGCASCGTAILFSVLSIFGASGFILWLPLHGEEFGIIGVLGLAASVWYLLGELQHPYVCKI